MKSKSPTKVILFFILISHLFSCEKATKWELKSNDSDLIVVNGLITNEKKEHTVILSSPVHQLNEIAQPISGAVVHIFDGDTYHLLEEKPSNSGIYKTSADYRAFINKIYTLIITVNQVRYFTSVNLLPVKPFNPLKYKFDEKEQMFAIDSVAQAFDSDESAIYEISIDWTALPGYESVPIESKKAIMYYYSLSTIDVSEVFASEKEKIYFPEGTSIIEKKYSLTPNHAAFIRSILLETEWSGGLFDVAHGNVNTNLSQGALGFFGACTVIQQNIIVN